MDNSADYSLSATDEAQQHDAYTAAELPSPVVLSPA